MFCCNNNDVFYIPVVLARDLVAHCKISTSNLGFQPFKSALARRLIKDQHPLCDVSILLSTFR